MDSYLRTEISCRGDVDENSDYTQQKRCKLGKLQEYFLNRGLFSRVGSMLKKMMVNLIQKGLLKGKRTLLHADLRFYSGSYDELFNIQIRILI
jgi:hypothetical protein